MKLYLTLLTMATMSLHIDAKGLAVGGSDQTKLGQERPPGSIPSDERSYMPVDEMDDFVWKKFQELENRRNDCKNGEFLSFTTKSCESCEKYCPDGIDLTMCGRECSDYYRQLQYNNLEERLGWLNGEIILAFVMILFCAFSVFVIIFGVVVMKRKLQAKAASKLNERFEEHERNLKEKLNELRGFFTTDIEDIRKKITGTASSDETPDSDSEPRTELTIVKENPEHSCNERRGLLSSNV